MYIYVLSVIRLNSISNIKVQISVGPGGVWTIYKNTTRVYKCIYIYLDSRFDHSGLLIGLGLIWTHSMWTQSGFARLLQINVGVTLIL